MMHGPIYIRFILNVFWSSKQFNRMMEFIFFLILYLSEFMIHVLFVRYFILRTFFVDMQAICTENISLPLSSFREYQRYTLLDVINNDLHKNLKPS